MPFFLQKNFVILANFQIEMILGFIYYRKILSNPVKNMYKIIIFLVIFFTNKNALSDFVHPLNFDEKTQKKEVLDYIKDRVKQDYCSGSIDMYNTKLT
jgi:hypothetical protein